MRSTSLLLPSLLLALLAGPTACGDNTDDGAPDADVDEPDAEPPVLELLDRLRALPGVTVEEWFVPEDLQDWFPPGHRYFDLWFTQPVDHDDPSAGTFEQYVSLIHRDEHAPMVVYTSGYDAGWAKFRSEPAELLEANQISIEYRFYAGSRPAAGVPWDHLRVEQATADQHAILTALGAIYDGNRIMTGGSKGGEHALQFAKHYPDDVDGVVAYVPPVITAYPDLRYDGVLDRIGTDECRAAVRAVARELLVRRDMVEARAVAEASFSIAGVEKAVDTAVSELEFAFWMTQGVEACGDVPAPTATDAVLYQFLSDIGPPAMYGDEDLDVYGAHYLFQDAVELGYPIWDTSYLDDLLVHPYADWRPYLPASEPFDYDAEGTPSIYDPTEARALADWVESTGERIMTINGEWDPWAAGSPRMELDGGRDALDLWVPQGSHWSSGIYSLPPDDQQAALDALFRWAGVDGARARVRDVPRPRASMASRGPGAPSRGRR